MSKLVYVSHEAADGRHSRAKKSLIHAHTLQYNRRKSKRLPPSSSTEPYIYKDLADRTTSTSKLLDAVVSEEDPKTDDRTSSSVVHPGHVSLPYSYHSTIPEPIGITMLGPNGEDVQSIGQWYFHNHDWDKKRVCECGTMPKKVCLISKAGNKRLLVCMGADVCAVRRIV